MPDLVWFPREQERLASEWPWLVDLICCGRDEGIEACLTDEFRESYCTGPATRDPLRPWSGGHDRAGIVRRSPPLALGES